MIRLIAQYLWRRRRNIFRYNDGRRVRSADPIAVAIALHEHKTFLPRHLGEATDGDPEAMIIVARAACDVFGVTPLAANGKTGLTAAECLELMQAFDAYLFALKKNIERSLTKRGYTESMSQGSSEPTTNGTSDCGPIETASLSETPTASGLESLPLSVTT
jgi:hypothetical protein